LPQIDDRHFTVALQYFLQKVGKITLEYLRIVPPEGNDCDGGPKVNNGGAERLDLADAQMPENINNFGLIILRFITNNIANSTFMYSNPRILFLVISTFRLSIFCDPAKFIVAKCQSCALQHNERNIVTISHPCSAFN
jgi:hypothetical protein